ncbi:unnamed protein product, partial [marine sediment metagenome]
ISRKKVLDLYGIFSIRGFRAMLELYRLEAYLDIAGPHYV